VALLIRLGTALLGQSTLAVRLAFVVLSSVALYVLAWVAAGLSRHGWRAGLWAVLCLLCMPEFQVAGFAANPDVPLLACVAVLLALASPSASGLTVARAAVWGLLVGLGTCAKLHAAVLALPLVALAWGARRRWLALGAGLGAACLGALPLLIWNATHGWAQLAYHLARRHTRPVGPSLANLAQLIGGQLAYVSPLVLLGLAAALVVLWRRRREPLPRLLLWLALPLLLSGYLLCLVVPGAEPHWPAMGYLPLVVALAGELPAWLARRSVRILAALGLGLSALAALALHLHVLTDAGVRLLSRLPPGAYVARYDLSNELVGWDRVADTVAATLARLPAEPRVRVAGCHYTSCSQLAFASRGRFQVVCPSARLDQYDFFPGGDGSSTHGGDLLYVRDERFPYDAGQLYRCDSVQPTTTVRIRRGGVQVRQFELQLCRNFDGLRARTWPPRP
jgi:4-amino-4-deoxy-L-arabinose transferase-like glycosyltransferase